MKPYYEQGGISIYCGDCREVLPTLEAGSVDAIVTDPPYGQSNESYDRGVPPEVWRECYRVASQDAILLSFAGNPTYHRIASDVEAAGWKVRQMWGWIYRDGVISSAWPREGFDRLAPAFDPIVFATKGKVLLDLERVGDGEWNRTRHDGDRVRLSDRSSTSGSERASGHWPRNIIASKGLDGFQFFVLSRTSPALRAERTDHPNQKPLWLMSWLLSKLPPGWTILDPYMGSGTTLRAAKDLGCKAIGIEINERYCEIAARRLEQGVFAWSDPAEMPV
jgi:DNA modification methylase